MTALRWLIIALFAAPSLASAQALVRVADYPNFGRVVFEFAAPTGFKVVGKDDRLLITFEGAPQVGSASRLPRNVRAIQGGVGSATLVIAPGARFRTFRERSRVGIDVLDPAPNRNGHNAAQINPTSAAAARPLPLDAPVLPAVLRPPVSTEAPQATPAVPVRQSTLPDPRQADAPPAVSTVVEQPNSILFPFEPGIGAAAFHRAGAGVVVFDQRAPVDVALLGRSPAFADTSVQLGQTVTVLTVPLLPNRALALLREPQGWRVTIVEESVPAVAPIAGTGPAGLLLKFDRPGSVVTIMDPSTGLALLIGTVDSVAGVGPATTPARRTPGYAMLPTWLGVAVEPLSDLVELRLAADGFVLTSPGIPAVGDAPAPPAASFTQRFVLPDLPTPALLQRLKAQIAAAAAAPPRARSPDRIAAAQSLLSLGLATEAQAVLALVATEDPAAAADPNVTGLLAVAALLAGRSPEATGLDDPRLDGTDDITLWRGLRGATSDADPEAGRSLARLLPLASAYPAALRDRLRPLVIEAAVASGQAASVASALADTADATLGFARALQSERDGDVPAALLALDVLTAGRDQLVQIRAGVRAVELRLRSGLLDPAQAADALERYAAIWRGDFRESRLRLRVAELRTAAGAFRPALDMLRDTERLFPEQQPAIRAAMAAVFQAMLSAPQAVPPIELVTLASDYAALLPHDAGDSISAMLADKLLALDLPGRAGPLLASLMATTPAGPARAAVGARLAQAQLELAAFPAAEAALNASEASGLPAALLEQRALLRAHARAAQGDLPAAIAGLLALGTSGADDLRATLLTEAADWSGSLAALADLAAKAIPAAGPLSDAMQDIVLRQATSAVQANDKALLAELWRRHGARLAGARADLFHLLAAEPLRSPSDLPRTATELALARLLPARLQTLSAQNSR